MKKITLIAALALLGGSLFAYGPGMGPGAGVGPGMGRGADIDWKVGTVVTTEYKKATGQVTTSTTLWGNVMAFKADGVEYQLFLPRVTELSALKSGDTITVEGTFTTIKADPKVAPSVHPFKVTVNGKEIDLSTAVGNGRGGMMGDDRGGMMGGRGGNNGPRR